MLAVVAVIAFLSRSGHGADGGWGFIVPALIIWRVLAGRHQHHDDHHQHRHDHHQHRHDRWQHATTASRRSASSPCLTQAAPGGL